MTGLIEMIVSHLDYVSPTARDDLSIDYRFLQ